MSNRLANAIQAEHLALKGSAEGRAAIAALMGDAELAVAQTAATHALAWAPKEAELVLERAASGPGLDALDAEYVLLAFRAGTLNLDWQPRLSTTTSAERMARRRTTQESDRRALNAAISVHGLIMNEGLLHALEVAGGGYARAIEGFRTTGRDDVAGVLEQLLDIPGVSVVGDLAERSNVEMRLSEEQGERADALTRQYEQLSDPQRSVQDMM